MSVSDMCWRQHAGVQYIFDLMHSRHNKNFLNKVIEEKFALHVLETHSILKR